MAKMKSYLLPSLSCEEIIAAGAAKKPGVFRRITWITDEIVVGEERDIITITKTATVRIGIRYDNMKSVIARKAAEDEAVGGGPKIRKPSSYTRRKDEKGRFIYPVFIVCDKKTEAKMFLQVFSANLKHGKTTELFYKNGTLFCPDDAMMEEISKERTIRRTAGPINTWVLPLNKIIKIQ